MNFWCQPALIILSLTFLKEKHCRTYLHAVIHNECMYRLDIQHTVKTGYLKADAEVQTEEADVVDLKKLSDLVYYLYDVR